MTQDEVLAAAQAKWPTLLERGLLAHQHECTPAYIYQVLTGNKRMPGWMLSELNVEQVRVTEYRRR